MEHNSCEVSLPGTATAFPVVSLSAQKVAQVMELQINQFPQGISERESIPIGKHGPVLAQDSAYGPGYSLIV